MVDTNLIGVVGAGNMGSGIAQKYATEGFQVIVIDRDQKSADLGYERVKSTLDAGVKRKIFNEEKRDAILGRMTFSADKSLLKNASLVVEAIFENKAVKQQLFQELDAICSKETILATNTSSFFVDDVAEGSKNPERILGLHYFYHPAMNRLVEVIGGTKTSQDAFDRAWSIQERSAKTPIKSKDAPGFIVNRYFVPWLNESMRLVDEGIADIATVEAVTKDVFGVGMGPFELMNVTGVPITLHAATTLGEQLGDFYAPCEFIRPQVENKENWNLDGQVDESKKEEIQKRLMGVVFQIACQIVFDEKVCTLEDCDLGARVGLRWPKGPFEMMNSLGMEKSHAAVQSICTKYSDVKMPAILEEKVKENRNFDIQWVKSRVDNDGVGYLTIARPDAMNALSEVVMQQIESNFDRLTENTKCKGIVVEGEGKAFVAGADVSFFVREIEANNVDGIVSYAKKGQEIFRKIDLSEKPVVCKLHGLSLGGGCELALACDAIIATNKASFGFPETGIGIYPGLGGTQRIVRRVGVALGRWLVLTGQILNAKKALELGIIDQLVPENELEESVRTFVLNAKAKDEVSPPTNVPSSYENLATVFGQDFEALSAGSLLDVEDVSIEKSVSKLKFKAPIALKMADDLLNGAKKWSLKEGLSAESDGLATIFSTEDALEGMKSVVKRYRPSFTGK